MGLEPRLPGPVTPKSPAKATSTSGSNDFEASNGVDLHVQEKETSTTSQSGHPSIPIMVDDLSQAVVRILSRYRFQIVRLTNSRSRPVTTLMVRLVMLY